jgi:hypothetical protein
MSSRAIHLRGVPSTGPLVIVLGPGGNNARIQFGHACSLEIFRSDRPQKIQGFRVVIGARSRDGTLQPSWVTLEQWLQMLTL